MEYVDYIPHWEEWKWQEEVAVDRCQWASYGQRAAQIEPVNNVVPVQCQSLECRPRPKVKKPAKVNKVSKDVLTREQKIERKKKSALLRQKRYKNLKKLRSEEEKVLASEILLKLQEEDKLRRTSYSTLDIDKNNVYTGTGEPTSAFEGEHHAEIDNEVFIKPCIIYKEDYRSL